MTNTSLSVNNLSLTENSPAVSFGQLLPRLENGVTLLSGAPLASPVALPFCAPFLLAGQPVVAVDGANCFDLYRLTEWAQIGRAHV